MLHTKTSIIVEQLDYRRPTCCTTKPLSKWRKWTTWRRVWTNILHTKASIIVEKMYYIEEHFDQHAANQGLHQSKENGLMEEQVNQYMLHTKTFIIVEN
jgi:hypothetical protein